MSYSTYIGPDDGLNESQRAERLNIRRSMEDSLSGTTTHELSDRELIATLYGDVQSLASIVATMADKMDSAERSITQIVEEVKPTLDRLQKSPLIKMLGG